MNQNNKNFWRHKVNSIRYFIEVCKLSESQKGLLPNLPKISSRHEKISKLVPKSYMKGEERSDHEGDLFKDTKDGNKLLNRSSTSIKIFYYPVRRCTTHTRSHMI